MGARSVVDRASSAFSAFLESQRYPVAVGAVRYDYREVADCAGRLIANAAAIVRASTVIGGFVGAAAGWLLTVGAAAAVSGPFHSTKGAATFGVLFGAALGALSGYQSARARTLMMRLDAQNALCFREVHEMVTGASGETARGG